jgi:hypothetical protein
MPLFWIFYLHAGGGETFNKGKNVYYEFGETTRRNSSTLHPMTDTDIVTESVSE